MTPIGVPVKLAGVLWLIAGISSGGIAFFLVDPLDSFIAIEVNGDERDRVIVAFHAKTPKPFSRGFDQRPSAADHPTFRREPTKQRADEAREAIRP